MHLVSPYPCRPGLDLASAIVLPIGFSGAAGSGVSASSSERSQGRWVRRALSPRTRTRVRHWLAPLTLPIAGRRLRAHLDRLQPDLVHAMRIPYEGMLAAAARPAAPLLISVWGNDFTLHAPATPVLARLTRTTLRTAAALHTDCSRDRRLAHEWGFPADRPVLVAPGGGGVQTDLFHPPRPDAPQPEAPCVINPRGLRAYVCTNAFFHAIPGVLERRPEVRFICPAMAGEASVIAMAMALGVSGAVELLPRLSRAEMADQFRRAQVVVSPTTHDGTPNTLLEAMASGCFPVAGDLDSIREWITPGENGVLVDPSDPDALAGAILQALESPALRARAQARNLELIRTRAERGLVMARAEEFVRQVVGEGQSF